ncbi:hypothetical protein FGG08_002628 [Glutinoglossum americanum]|uniref:Uncharacterized protein n=1 Tax=Glutinoglossum americanum TaxID=1670608 RepID=A0A9P8IB99_9PEZI|nr:hypothetical protein FGG08_002628 [Glutinoglossum americanum]
MDGSGCNNCKTSGTDPGQCLFLRVQCEVRELVPDHVQLTRGYNQVSSVECPPNVWSYCSNLGSAASQMNGSLGTLSASTNASISSVVPMAVPSSNYPRIGLSQGYASAHYSAMPSKAAYPGPYGTGYSDDDPYNLHTPPYMFPSQDSLSVGSAYGPHDTIRGWGPMGQNNKPTSGGLFLDQDSSPSYGNAHLPYLHPVVSRIPSATTDGSSLFPAMTSLVTSLPVPSTAGDRVLPNPALGRPQTSATTLITAAATGSDSLNYYGSAQPASYKSSHNWGCDSSASVGSQGPTMAASSTGSGPMTPSTRKGSATNFADSSLGYISISTTPESPGSATPALSYSSASLPVPVTQSSNYSSSVSSAFPPSSSNTALLPSQPTGQMYSYSTESSVSKRDSVSDTTTSDEATLVSGQTYTRIRQPHLQHPVPMDGLRRTSLELRPYSVQHSPVNGLTTGKGY